MNMHLIDWGIVLAFLAVLFWGAMSTRRYTKSVAAFLAAERSGGRYLIAVADQMSQLGVITLVGYFELTYKVGYTSDLVAADGRPGHDHHGPLRLGHLPLSAKREP